MSQDGLGWPVQPRDVGDAALKEAQYGVWDKVASTATPGLMVRTAHRRPAEAECFG